MEAVPSSSAGHWNEKVVHTHQPFGSLILKAESLTFLSRCTAFRQVRFSLLKGEKKNYYIQRKMDLLVGNSVWQKAFGSLNTLVRFPLQALQGWLVNSTAQESIPLATNFLSTESSCSMTDSTAN